MAAAREIAIVTGSLSGFGATRVMILLANEWSRMGHPVTFILLREDGTKPSYALDPAIEIVSFAQPSGMRIKRIATDHARLVSYAKQHPDAVLMSFLPEATIKCGAVAPFVRNEVLFAERNDPRRDPKSAFKRALRTLAFRFADVCVFQTGFAKSLFPTSVQRKGVVIPNPLAPSTPQPYEGERRKAVVAVCRLDEQKNIPMLLSTFSMLGAPYHDYVLEIYGEGPLRGEVEDLIASMGLSERVKLCGFVNDVHERIKDAALYVSTSDYEGISNSMLEALAIGLPCVVTDCPIGGAKEAIQDGVNGLLVPVGDAEACCSAMERILENPDLSNQFSLQACTIRQRLQIQEIAQSWIDAMKKGTQ